ncbi:MAG: diguanylate cyclase [Thiovulaceae bacterium]|nr:diguanylate cyclase [Sulfurimonadaceae bacterium]
MDELEKMVIWLIEQRYDLVNSWLNKDIVQKYFLDHKINNAQFAKKFAHPILLYNLDVLRGNKLPGTCHIMNQFVNYMIKKNIKSQDIFIICTQLRSTILESLSKNDPDLFKKSEIMIKILDLFDENLSGVLANFDAKLLEYNLQNQANLELIKYAKRVQIILDTQKNIIFKLHDNKLFLANKPLYLATGVLNAKEFQKCFFHPLDFIETTTMYENLFKRKEYDQWLMQIIKNNGGACEIEFFNHQLNKHSMMSLNVQKIDELNDFIFTLENFSETERKIKKIENIIALDPLTDLANLTKFKEMVQEQLQAHSQDELNILMIHLEGFKIFNDTHDKKSGEDLIKNISDILKEDNKDNSAKIDFERFALILKEKKLNNAQEIINKINLLLEENNCKDRIKPLAAIVVHRKNDTIELMLARADLLLEQVKMDSLETIVDETLIIEKERIRLEQEKKFLQLMKINYQEKRTISVTNYYLEIGIKSDATILFITKNQLIVTVRKVALFSLYQGDPVYIQMPQKPDYKAFVEKVDKFENHVTLHLFQAVESSALDRKHVHVKLDRPLEVSLSFESEKINGQLQSVSINTFEISLQHIHTLQIGDEIEITANLSDKEDLYRGQILKIIPLTERFILVVHLEVTSSTEEILSPYVSNRQLEIIKNLQKNILKM